MQSFYYISNSFLIEAEIIGFFFLIVSSNYLQISLIIRKVANQTITNNS